jgi:hypothetical protein
MKRRRRLRRLVPDPELIRRRAAGEPLRGLASDYGVAHTTLGRYFVRPLILAIVAAPVAVHRFALFAPISWGTPPFRGVSAHARRLRVAPDVTASRPEALRRLRFNKFRVIHGFHTQVGSYSRTERTAGDTARRAHA